MMAFGAAAWSFRLLLWGGGWRWLVVRGSRKENTASKYGVKIRRKKLLTERLLSIIEHHRSSGIYSNIYITSHLIRSFISITSFYHFIFKLSTLW
jgi:hypothetical protein